MEPRRLQEGKNSTTEPAAGALTTENTERAFPGTGERSSQMPAPARRQAEACPTKTPARQHSTTEPASLLTGRGFHEKTCGMSVRALLTPDFLDSLIPQGRWITASVDWGGHSRKANGLGIASR